MPGNGYKEEKDSVKIKMKTNKMNDNKGQNNRYLHFE